MQLWLEPIHRSQTSSAMKPLEMGLCASASLSLQLHKAKQAAVKAAIVLECAARGQLKSAGNHAATDHRAQKSGVAALLSSLLQMASWNKPSAAGPRPGTSSPRNLGKASQKLTSTRPRRATLRIQRDLANTSGAM